MKAYKRLAVLLHQISTRLYVRAACEYSLNSKLGGGGTPRPSVRFGEEKNSFFWWGWNHDSLVLQPLAYFLYGLCFSCCYWTRMDKEKIGRWPNLKYCSNICLRVIWKTKKTLNQDCQCAGLDVKSGTSRIRSRKAIHTFMMLGTFTCSSALIVRLRYVSYLFHIDSYIEKKKPFLIQLRNMQWEFQARLSLLNKLWSHVFVTREKYVLLRWHPGNEKHRD